MLTRRAKLLQLLRFVPFCERNCDLLELGPKGTGKSHVYAEFSPHGMLISGSEVTAPKLFVSNSSGKIGLVGFWDCVCFDEFAGKDKKVDKALVDIMKNYMANRSFSRGIEQLTAEASMVFMGNDQEVGRLYAEALAFLRAAPGQIHRLGLPRSTSRLQPRLGSGPDPKRSLHERVWLHRRLLRRDPQAPAYGRLHQRLQDGLGDYLRDFNPRPDGYREDVFRLDEDSVPAWRCDRR
jgi:hypothetical protein